MISEDSQGFEIDSESASAGETRPLPKILRWFWIGSGSAFALTLLVSYLEYRAGIPWNVRFPIGDKLFGDLLEFVPAFQRAHPAWFFRSTAFSAMSYPPFGAILYAPMYSFGHPVMFYFAIFAAWLGILIEGVRRRFIASEIARATALLFPLTVCTISFPIQGLVQRANIELFVWIFTATGIWAYLQGRNKLAALLWGLAAATKLYPIILLVLLVTRPRMRAFALGLATFVVASVLSMAYLGPNLSTTMRRSVNNVFGYQNVRTSEWSVHEFAANHSAFMPFKFVASIVDGAIAAPTHLYYLCGGLVFVAVFLVRVHKMPITNQVLAVVTFMVMFPPISYFYTLVHLYAPLLMLVFLAIRSQRANLRIPGLAGTILLFAPIFASFTIFTFPSKFLFGGLIQALMLITLFLRAVQFPFSLAEARRVRNEEESLKIEIAK